MSANRPPGFAFDLPGAAAARALVGSRRLEDCRSPSKLCRRHSTTELTCDVIHVVAGGEGVALAVAGGTLT